MAITYVNKGHFSMSFLHQSAVLVRLPYRLADMWCNDNRPQNLSGLQRAISLSCVQYGGSGFAPCHLLSRNHTVKAAFIQTILSSLSNNILVYAYCPRIIINSTAFHTQQCTLSFSKMPGLDTKLYVTFPIQVIDDFLAKKKEDVAKPQAGY